ncbi:MAG: hypothetical protein JJU41_04655 [Bacteroidetes bacterium]|nr:hypothetical protein [Bacteroidota bacterium]MCH8524755.1 hypothetical protein [Balneolales bacterium]
MREPLNLQVQAPFGCILNPGANRSRALRNAEKVMAFLEDHFPGSQLFITSAKSDIGKLAFEASQAFGRILVCGGDGTINEVVQVAMVTGAQVGIIPMGSGNDFVKTPGISRNLRTALEQLHTSIPFKIDVLRYSAHTENGKVQGIVVNTLGIGFDGKTNAEAARMRYVKGHLMYALAAMKSAFTSGTSRARIGSLPNSEVVQHKELFMLAFANGRVEGGNFQICPHASLTDGLADMVSIPPVSLFTIFTRLPLFMIGMQYLTKIIEYEKVRNASIVFETPLPMHVDGEQIGLQVSELQVEVIPAAVTLLLPRECDTTRL